MISISRNYCIENIFNRNYFTTCLRSSGITICAHRSLRGLTTMKLEDLSIRMDKFKIKPIYADACGNKFLIYDLIKCEKSIPEVKNSIWEILKRAPTIDDGLLLRKTSIENAHLSIKMHVLEPDKTEADFCGNGARAVGFYLKENYGEFFSSFSLVSRFGNHPIVEKEGVCFINMGNPIIDESLIEFQYEDRIYQLTYADAVEPHLVTRDTFESTELTKLGDAINLNLRDRFPNGVNVNCLRVKGDNELDVITYERGLYRITQACGTGSTACVATAIHKGWLSRDKTRYQVNVLGGKLDLILDEKSDFFLGGEVNLKR